MIADRYQTSDTEAGAFPTAEWFAALLEGVDGPLGSVLDVGCAEGVMSRLAADAGAITVLGVDTNPERIAAAGKAEGCTFWEAATTQVVWRYDTVILSMIAHWVGREETERLAGLAERNVLVIFRLANDDYTPANGSWFPTLAELDVTIGGVRTSERLLLTQDEGKEVWAATYRTDLRIEGETVWKRGVPEPLRHGRDLYGDAPFRPRHHPADEPRVLEFWERTLVRSLVRGIARDSLASGTYPSDLSPRNIIVGEDGAFLIDDRDDERMPLRAGLVAAEYLPIWQATLGRIGIAFAGDMAGLL